MRRILALGEARGYEPDTSRARFVFALLACWFEPIENGVQAAQRAREGLVAGGDLANAGYSYYTTVHYLLDCAPTLDAYVAEVEAGLAFARRTGNEQTGQWLDSYRWLAGVLRGESAAAAGEPVPIDRYAGNPLALALRSSQPCDRRRHLRRSGRPGAAHRGGDAAAAGYRGQLLIAVARLLRGLALAGQARASRR